MRILTHFGLFLLKRQRELSLMFISIRNLSPSAEWPFVEIFLN
jgi:hypothetical protein